MLITFVFLLPSADWNNVVISLPHSTVREKMTEKGTGKDHKNSVNSSRVHGGIPVCNWSVWRKGFMESKSEKVVVYVENVAVSRLKRDYISCCMTTEYLHTCMWHVTKPFSVILQDANDSDRRYKLIRSKMNIHKINISSLLANQLLHVDISVFYPDTSLRLFPIAVFFQWVTLPRTDVVCRGIQYMMHVYAKSWQQTA